MRLFSEKAKAVCGSSPLETCPTVSFRRGLGEALSTTLALVLYSKLSELFIFSRILRKARTVG